MQTGDLFQRTWHWVATHLFRNYIRRGVAATRREFAGSLITICAGLFLAYLVFDLNKPVSWVYIAFAQVAAILLPWFGGLLGFGYLFGRRFGYEPLRDVDMMAAGRSGGYAAAAAAGLVALFDLARRFWSS